MGKVKDLDLILKNIQELNGGNVLIVMLTFLGLGVVLVSELYSNQSVSHTIECNMRILVNLADKCTCQVTEGETGSYDLC